MSDNTTTLRGKSAADKLTLAISTSKGHQGEVKNVTRAWPVFIERLSTPHKDNMAWKEYAKLPKDEQIKRKNVGYFVGGHFDDGKRKVQFIHKHCLLTLDVDKPSPELFDELFDPFTGFLVEFEYFVYTTRSYRGDVLKCRVVIPLLVEVANDMFIAASRILARHLDPTMVAVDPVTFRPAQVMYYPSICSDGEFKFFHHRGRLLDVETDILAGFEGDWRDYMQLPRGERDSARPSAAKAEHPSQKRGIVGAYCRARSIFDQLDLMRDLYEPSDDGPTPMRWSYLLGTSRNGAIVFPEDWRFQSFHSTDPLYGKNCTAFDMQMIHRFGHLDPSPDTLEPDQDPREMPSYKALVKAIQDEPEYADVMRALADMNFNQDAMADDVEFNSDLEDEEETGTPAPGAIVEEARTAVEEVTPSGEKKVRKDDVDILDLLDLTDKGAVRKTPYNLELILNHDPRFRGCFRYNEFLRRVVTVRRVSSKALDKRTPKITNKGNGDRMTAWVRTVVRTIISAPNRQIGDSQANVGWGVVFGDDETVRAIESVAVANSFHPVKKYLDAVKWDGVHRISTMFKRYWHTKDDAYHAAVAEIVMVAAVCRIFEPGHKFDYMLIIEGLQGCRKSTSVKKLAVLPEWFGEMMADLTNNERVVENVNGRWIVEWPELSSLTRAESEIVKAIMSSGTLSGRLAYERDTADFPLQGVFVGTTNDKEYLKDPTGNRRYLPIKVPDGKIIDVVALERDRDQLWAEALQLYQWWRRQYPKGELPLTLTGDAERTARLLQHSRVIKGKEVDWKPQIEEFLVTKTSPTIARGHGGFSVEDDPDGEGAHYPHTMCVKSIAQYALGLDPRFLKRTESDLIAKTLDSVEDLERSKHDQRFNVYGRTATWIVKPL